MDRNLKQSLLKKLNKSELEMLPRAFEVIGSIAIIEIPAGLKKKEKLIAESILKLHKNVKTVVKKAGKFSGRFRLRATKFLAGIDTRETLYRENGCLMKLDIDRCYFSSRMSSDRLDIAKQVKKGEKVLVMFGGIAPYAVVIGKYSKAKEVISVEINRTASDYAKKNVSLNKLGNVEIIQGDVKRIIPLMKKKKIKFDRIVMTRPQLENTFLHEAFIVAKKGTIIHMHDFSDEKDMPDESFARIFEAAAKDKIKYHIMQWKKIGDVAPHRYRLRIDFKIL